MARVTKKVVTRTLIRVPGPADEAIVVDKVDDAEVDPGAVAVLAEPDVDATGPAQVGTSTWLGWSNPDLARRPRQPAGPDAGLGRRDVLLGPRRRRPYESDAVVAFAPRDPVATGAETMVLLMPRYVEVLRRPDGRRSRRRAQLGIAPSVVRSRSDGLVEAEHAEPRGEGNGCGLGPGV